MTVALGIAALTLAWVSPWSPPARAPVDPAAHVGSAELVVAPGAAAPAPDADADAPDAAAPDAAAPDAAAPDAAAPDDAAPDDAAPDDAAPDDAAPEGDGPDVAGPDDAATDAPAEPTEPADDDPSEAGAPGDSKPTGGEPADTKPSDAKPEDSGSPSLDDIFGTSETQTNVEVVSEKGETPGGPVKNPGGSGTGAKGIGARARAKLSDKLDTRIRIVSSVYYDTARVEERGFGRNENRIEMYFAYTANKHLQIVGDVEPVFFGVAQTRELSDLASRQLLAPFHVESDAAYIALNDVLPNLDIKVGRQTLVWGSADRFNPTNNINPDDLEDRPLFTEPIANQMVVVDYAPLADKLWFQGVYVPIFYPALLPPSAAAALKDPQAQVPYAFDSDQQRIGELQALLDINPMLVPTVVDRVKTPRPRFSNGQSAVKLGTTLGGVDLSFSYYNGRHDIPTPILAESTTKDPQIGNQAECCFNSEVVLIYPRMQVIGADFSTQLPFLGNMGLWGEGGLFIPQAQSMRIEFPISVDVTPDDGIANPVPQMEGPTIRSTPFIKATAGLDYTFGKHVYVQAQYLRGFIDEFGVDHIGNYLVGGTDLIFFGRHLIFRAFGVVDFPTGKDDPLEPGEKDQGSYVIFPEILVIPPWGSVQFELGSFFLLGPDRTKFGQSAAGSSIVFFKVAGTF